MSGTACDIVQPLDVAEQFAVRFAAEVQEFVLFVYARGQISIPGIVWAQKYDNQQGRGDVDGQRGQDEGQINGHSHLAVPGQSTHEPPKP